MIQNRLVDHLSERKWWSKPRCAGMTGVLGETIPGAAFRISPLKDSINIFFFFLYIFILIDSAGDTH